MVSKTRRRQIKRSNQESSFDQVDETPVAVSNKKSNKQNNDQTTVTLSSVELENMIKNAVERELLRHGVDRNLNNSRSEAVQANIRTNNPIIGDVGPSNNFSNRDTHFIASHGNNDRLRSREHIGTDPAALAPQTRTGPDYADCHMATEMGLPGNGNKENRNMRTLKRGYLIAESQNFLTGNTLCDTYQRRVKLNNDDTRQAKQRKSLFNNQTG